MLKSQSFFTDEVSADSLMTSEFSWLTDLPAKYLRPGPTFRNLSFLSHILAKVRLALLFYPFSYAYSLSVITLLLIFPYFYFRVLLVVASILVKFVLKSRYEDQDCHLR